MRDAIYIVGLFLVFAFLVTRYPSEMPAAAVSPCPAFASFIMLSPAAHAAWLEAARTSWQVRNQGRGRPSFGRLDFDVPLLSATIPPVSLAGFSPLPSPEMALPPPDAATYAFLPPTCGADLPDFAIPRTGAEAVSPPGDGRISFSRREMLSLDHYKSVKEIMK